MRYTLPLAVLALLLLAAPPVFGQCICTPDGCYCNPEQCAGGQCQTRYAYQSGGRWVSNTRRIWTPLELVGVGMYQRDYAYQAPVPSRQAPLVMQPQQPAMRQPITNPPRQTVRYRIR